MGIRFKKEYRPLLLIVTIFWCSNIRCHKSSEYVKSLETMREEKKAAFLNPATTILDSIELSQSKGLLFFPVDASYKVVATITAQNNMPVFDMPHSKEKTRQYQRFGEISFMLKGEKITLPVYTNANLHKEKLVFFPFTDLTNGKTTYGGGRYIDLPEATGEVELDFNQCYHPYCAYSHQYSCPIVPKENHIPIAVEAGEQL
jgi:uncharacterized protein (DUF1684 family)